MPRLSTTASLVLLLAMASCGGAEEAATTPAGEPAGRVVDLVSQRHEDAVLGAEGWGHAQSATADLDGDGAPETAVILANAPLYRGRVDWQDSQPWQVYIEEQDGTRTYVYKQLLQLGIIHARLARPIPSQPPTIVLLEHTSRGFGAYEVRYTGPGQATTVELTQRQFDLTSLFQGTPDP